MRKRRCKYCNCVLSIYNPGKACAVHSIKYENDKLDKMEKKNVEVAKRYRENNRLNLVSRAVHS